MSTHLGSIDAGQSSRSRAQSHTVGVILLTAVIVILMGVFGAFYLGVTNERADSYGPLVDVDVNATADRVVVIHAGGDPIAFDELDVVVSVGDARERYDVDAANVSGNGDDRFDPTERFARDHGLGDGEMEVLAIHSPSNTILSHEYLDVGPDSGGTGGTTPTTASFTYAPSDPEPGDTLSFDASGSTGSGGIATYEWDWDGDGTIEDSTASSTIDHTFTSAGDFAVTLTVTDGDGGTATTSETISVDSLRAPDDPANPVNGVDYQYYEASGEYDAMPDFGGETPTRTGTSDGIDLDPTHRDDNFAFRYTGYVEVPQDGQYTFSTTSDDGSDLYIGDQQVVDNGGLHGNQTESGTIGLEAGKHAITVTMFEHTGQAGLEVSWSGPGVSSGTVPASALYRTETPIAVFSASCAGPECDFDASGSSNPGGSIDTYEWDFGDGDTATGQTVSHTFDSTGDHTVTLTVTGDGGATDSEERTITTTPLQPSLSPGPVVQGVAYEYYDASGQFTALSDVPWASPNSTGTTDQPDLDPIENPSSADDVALRHQAYLDVPEDGTYTFYTTSDDGSRLYVDGQLVVDNAGLHAPEEESGQIALESGYHNVTVQWFERGGGVELTASWESDGIAKEELPASRLYRSEQQARWETAGDWDAVTSSTGVVHETFGDRTNDTLSVGAPTGASNLSGYWHLDEDAGTTAADASPNGHDGTATQVTVGADGVTNTTAYDFGDQGWVEVGGFPNLDREMTVSAWIRTTDNTEQGQRIFADDESNTGGYAFSLGDGGTGQLRFFSRNLDSVSLDTGRVIENDRWYHVVAVLNDTAGTRQIYVNATEEASDTYTNSPGTDAGPISIGGETDAGEAGNRFDGRIDEVRVYDDALSQSDVDTLHEAGYNGTLTTGTKTFETAISPSSLSLRNVSATRPPGTSIDVTVHSDPDGDGTFEETSDSIALDGSASYAVSGLASESRQYRLAVSLNSTSPTETPTVDRLEIGG